MKKSWKLLDLKIGELFIDETEVVSFWNRYEQNDNVALKSYRFNAMLILKFYKMAKSQWYKDEDLFSIEKFVQEHTQISKKTKLYYYGFKWFKIEFNQYW